MPWPTPQEYNEAIQNPRTSFADPDLAGGTVELGPLGLPRPITGNFASVYRVRGAGGDWAVRCFWREYADMQERYACISSHLRAAGHSYTVGFDYLQQGIRVGGVWYPILKMEWVDGRLLDAYVRQHLGDGKVLARLAQRWLDMVRTLEVSGCAHGDLQHGNVLIVGDELKLVDYDGMYVPALRGRGSHELGHQNYQHPARTAADFGPTIDRFSAMVVYLSLLALSSQPSIWDDVGGGDERLLFKRADFLAPDTSPLFAALDGHGDERVRQLSGSLRSALSLGPARVPPLCHPQEPPLPSRDRRNGLAQRMSPVLGIVLPGVGHVAVPDEPLTPANHPTWLADHIGIARPTLSFKGPMHMVRIWAIGLVVALMALLLAGVTVLSVAVVLAVVMGATGSLVTVGVLLAWYHRDPTVLQMKVVLARERAQGRVVAECRRAVRALQAERENREKMYARHVGGVQRRLDALRRSRDDELGVIRSMEERERLKAAEALAGARQRERAELEESLKAAQERHIGAYLRGSTLRSPALALPLAVKGRLWLAGVRTADDVTAQRIAALKAFGDEVVAAVVEWRVMREVEARASMPRQVDPARRDAITRKWSAVRTRAEAAAAAAEDRCHILQQSLAERVAREEVPLMEALVEAERDHAEALAQLDVRFAEASRRLQLNLGILSRIERERLPYRDVTFLRYLAAVVGA